MKLQLDTGQELEIPAGLSDIAFEDHIDFRMKEQDFIKHQDVGYLHEALQCVMELPDDCPYGDKFEERLLQVGDEISLMRLYGHYVQLVNTYEPLKLSEAFSVVIKDETYYIDPNDAMAALTGTGYTTGEVVTIMQFQKNYEAMKSKKGDFNGPLEFQLGCEELAVLLRPKGVLLPINPTQRHRFLTKQRDIMKRVPLNVVYDVRAFFFDILNDFVKTIDSSYFLSPQKLSERTRPKGPKYTSKKLSLNASLKRSDGKDSTSPQLSSIARRLLKRLFTGHLKN